MPTLPDDPLRRVTLNLYEADVVWLIRTYGSGWTVRIRDHIHAEVIHRQLPDFCEIKTNRLTLGDLIGEPRLTEKEWLRKSRTPRA